MFDLKIDMIATNEHNDVKQLLDEVESWAVHMFASEWNRIEMAYSDYDPESTRQKNKASRENYERLLVVAKLRNKLLCE